MKRGGAFFSTLSFFKNGEIFMVNVNFLEAAVGDGSNCFEGLFARFLLRFVLLFCKILSILPFFLNDSVELSGFENTDSVESFLFYLYINYWKGNIVSRQFVEKKKKRKRLIHRINLSNTLLFVALSYRNYYNTCISYNICIRNIYLFFFHVTLS